MTEKKIEVVGKTSEPEAEALFNEEGYALLWARRIGQFGYAVDVRAGRDAAFRARAVRWTVLTTHKKTEERTDRFEMETRSLDEAKNLIRDFRSYLP